MRLYRRFKGSLPFVLILLFLSFASFAANAADLSGEYYINSLSLDSSSEIAIVNITSSGDAIVVVSAYDPATKAFLGSGSVTVSKQVSDRDIFVPLSCEINDHVLLKAFMVDKHTYQPLCRKKDKLGRIQGTVTSSSETTVNIGQTTDFAIEYSDPGIDFLLSIYVEDPSIITCEWGDELNDHTDLISITGLKEGKTNLIVFMLDEYGNGISATLTEVTVRQAASVVPRRTSITLNQGQQTSVIIDQSLGLEGSYINYQTSNSNIQCEWGDWIDDYSIPLSITGISQGTTVIKIVLYDRYDLPVASASIVVNVINTGGTSYNFPLHLYSYDGKHYLGKLVTNKYDSDSIWNEYGDYGSKYGTYSIWNTYGDYGDKYSDTSAFNDYANKPPKIVDNNGYLLGYLTTNKYMTHGYTIIEIRQFLINHLQ